MVKRNFRWALIPSLALALVIASCAAQGKPSAAATVQSEPAISPADYDHPVRVACVGDSITYGFGIRGKKSDFSYPKQLGAMLGSRWNVKNFGVNSTTLLKNGDKPYMSRKEYTASLNFDPDVVVVMFGANDCKPRNWDAHGGEFVADYKELIASFLALPAHPRVWICRPTPCFPGNWDISNAAIEAKVIPAINQVVRESKVSLIDQHAALAGQAARFKKDHVHPDREGARLIAATVYRALTGLAAPAPAPAAPAK
jgi:acyl-CoA thioesterase I